MIRKKVPHNKFLRDVERLKQRVYKREELEKIVDMLAHGEKLPESCCDHKTHGIYKGCRDCHVTPDWILIYKIDKKTNTLFLIRTGTHSDLF